MGSIRVCDILDFYERRIKQASMLFVEACFFCYWMIVSMKHEFSEFRS